MEADDVVARLHAEHYGRLFGVAYRMLSSVTEAEDVVQDAFVRWGEADRSDVREPPAWLTTTVTRLCLDRLRSARWQRETYVGPWLPEPLATDGVNPEDIVGTADSLTFAFLVLLERLSPLERAVFVLHDVFGHSYDEVAAMLGRTPAAVRQLGARARRHLERGERRFAPDGAQQRAVTEAFLSACQGDDLDAMLALLAPDVTFVGDGGGAVPAVRHPLHGADAVVRFLRGLWRMGVTQGFRVELTEVNTEPALVAHDPRGGVETVLVFEVRAGRISAIRGVRNPAKLAAFGVPRARRSGGTSERPPAP